ncbi:MAG: adenosylhomocysteinase [Candidatus Hodarchaeota archaeon]
MTIKTDVGETYEVRDMNLVEEGRNLMEWANEHMPVLKKIRERFEKEKPLKGLKIGGCLHITKETSQLAMTLKAAGAEVALCASNPLSTQDPIAAALAAEGIRIYAWKGMDSEGYYRAIANVIKFEPEITLDDGADVVSTLHKLDRGETGSEIEIVKKTLGDRTDWINSVWGGAEETTTGVIRLRAMAKDGALKYPILATNDCKTKWEFDNLWGTGQSTIDGILRGTADLIAGSIFVVAGYGHCGRGVALRAKGLGARRVIVTEISPHRALTASMEGIEVMPMKDAALIGEFFVTATGCCDIITGEHLQLMKNGAVVCNTGHFDNEIDVKTLKKLATSVKENIRPLVDQYTLPNGNKINLLAQGRLVNLSNAEGHPCQVMDLSFADQALAMDWIVKNKAKIQSKGGVVLDIPSEIDLQVAELKCEAMGIKYDVLTQRQHEYLTGWEEGT